MMLRKILLLMTLPIVSVVFSCSKPFPFKKKSEAESINIVAQFQNPPSEYRPHVRMWVPQAAEDEQELRRQIAELADAGFGDVEIVAFDVARRGPASSGTNSFDKYGWGTEAWTRTMEIVLDEAGKNGIKATFTLGPAWPVASPLLKKDSDGVEIQLGCTRIDLDGNTCQASMPQDCFALVAGRRKSSSDNSIEFSSLTVITESASKDGEISWKAPDDSGLWTVFAYSNEKVGETKGGFPVVDHFSVVGTQAVIDYYTQVYSELDAKGLLKYLNGLFGDSLEYSAQVDWTPSFVEDFKAMKGYDITPFLPMLNNGLKPQDGGMFGGIFGGGVQTESFGDEGQKILNDYYSVLTCLFNKNHLDPIQHFLEGYGQNLRYQTAYGKHMEQSSTSMHVGIPEGEMMMIRNTFDNLRAQSGAVHVRGLKEYNAELQAEGGKNHAQSWQNVLFFIQRAFSVGVNNLTLHGYNYSGKFSSEGNVNGALPGVSWPGWEGFGRDGYSNSWGAEPLWKMAPAFTGFVARTGFILKQGHPKIDLAVYRESFWDNASFTVSEGDVWYRDGALLQDLGYSFDFVGLENLSLPSAKVKAGILCPDGPSYKAMIVDRSLDMDNNPVSSGQWTISLSAAQKILSLAKSGLPVVIVGELPTRATFYSDGKNADAQVSATMDKLASLANVRMVASYSEVPSALSAMDVIPDASVSQQANKDKVISMHRATRDVDFFYVYNRGNNANGGMATNGGYGWGYGEKQEVPYGSVSVEMDFAVTGTPYIMDAFSGEIVGVLGFTANNGHTVLPISLDANESVIIAFDRSGVISPTSEEMVKDYTDSRTIALDDWELIVESWTPSDNPLISSKNNISLTMHPLKAWKEVPALENISGIGTYTTSFEIEAGFDDGVGAEIDLGTVNFSYSLSVNGTEVPISQTSSSADIGKYLKKGTNTVTVVVYTTLNNAIKAITPPPAPRPGGAGPGPGPAMGMGRQSGRSHDWYGLMGLDGAVLIHTYRY